MYNKAEIEIKSYSAKNNSEKGSMAVYVSIVLLTMLLVLMAIFITSNSTRKSQLITAMQVKESYEADNDRAADIYSELPQNYI